jgi:hypothetical protein
MILQNSKVRVKLFDFFFVWLDLGPNCIKVSLHVPTAYRPDYQLVMFEGEQMKKIGKISTKIITFNLGVINYRRLLVNFRNRGLTQNNGKSLMKKLSFSDNIKA